MRYKTYIFDMDGTILDTLEDLADTMNYCLANNNLPIRNLTDIKSFVGNGIHKIVERSVPSGTPSDIVEEIFDQFNEYYKEHCSIKTKPYDGIIEMMKILLKNNCNIAVVSNKADYAVKQLCNDYFDNLIGYSIGAKEGLRKKPYPDSIYNVLNYFGCKLSDAVYIGDSEVDIETAKNVGIDLIIVSWGFRDKNYLKSLGAKNIIDQPSQIIF